MQSLYYNKHLILRHFKLTTWITAESFYAFLIFFVLFPFAVVERGESRIVPSAFVGVVSNYKVMRLPSEDWTPWICVILNCILGFNESHFLFKFKLEEEWTHRSISNIFIDSSPFKWSVACDSLAKLSADNGHCIAGTIADLSELRSEEAVLWSTE